MIDRIVFTGDFLRPVDTGAGLKEHGPADFRPSQNENILWFYRLFRRRLQEATGLPTEVKAWNRGIDTPLFYRMLDIEKGTSGWVQAYCATEFPLEMVYLVEDVFENSLVIAFEMPESLKHLLTSLRIPFIDFNIHPIRFLPDVFFAVQTNCPGIFDAMRRHHTPSADFLDWADLLAAAAVKLPPVSIPQGSALLVGQTNVDRSLIIDGSLRNLASYSAVLPGLLGNCRRVLFKPHPYNPTSFGLYEVGLPFRAIQWTSTNIYALLAHDSIDHVVGISSSALVEAAYFGKRATFLSRSPFDIPPTAEQARPGQHLSIYDACFDADFWREILSPLMPVTRPTGRVFRRPPNTLRLSLRNFWGFNEVSTDFLVQVYEAGRNARNALVPGL